MCDYYVILVCVYVTCLSEVPSAKGSSKDSGVRSGSGGTGEGGAPAENKSR